MKKDRNSFTLVELAMVVAVIAILAGAMIPAIRDSKEDAKVAKVLLFYESAKFACLMYNIDTGWYAHEDSPGGPSFPGPGNPSQLSGNPPIPMHLGWNGPYSTPFEIEDNPFSFIFPCPRPLAIARVQVTATVNFDLDGDGAQDRAGAGNQVTFYPAPQGTAKKINDKFDANIPGDWKATGRVRYSDVNQGFLTIYIAGGV